MSRVFVPFLFASAVASGCVAAEGDESFVIVANLVPEIDEATGLVTFTPSPTGPFLSQAFFSFSARSGFVGSQFESRVQAADGRESLRTIAIEGANISLEIGQIFVEDSVSGTVETRGTATTFDYKIEFSSSLPPNKGISVGIYDIVPVNIMADLRAAILDVINDPNKQVFVNISSTTTAFGDFYGDRIDATPFTFPVIVEKNATCRDLTCSPIDGESTANCPFDCRCGDEVCNPIDEDAISCPADCS